MRGDVGCDHTTLPTPTYEVHVVGLAIRLPPNSLSTANQYERAAGADSCRAACGAAVPDAAGGAYCPPCVCSHTAQVPPLRVATLSDGDANRHLPDHDDDEAGGEQLGSSRCARITISCIVSCTTSFPFETDTQREPGTMPACSAGNWRDPLRGPPMCSHINCRVRDGTASDKILRPIPPRQE